MKPIVLMPELIPVDDMDQETFALWSMIDAIGKHQYNRVCSETPVNAMMYYTLTMERFRKHEAPK